MTLDFINDFQIRLYKILSTDQAISAKVDKIYIAVTQDAKYPFLLINILRAENISRFNCSIYEIEFEICIFVRAVAQGNLTLLASLIDTRLSTSNCQVTEYIIAGIRVSSINFQRSQDLMTTKLIMHYKALIKERM